MKTLRFKNNLVPLILSGEKYVTWRIFDDKNLQTGDILELVNSDAGEKFGEATIVSVHEKKLQDVSQEDFLGHETYKDKDEMFEIYKSYYGDALRWDSIVKIIKFNFQK